MASIPSTLARIKDDPRTFLKDESILNACRLAGHVWRDRELNPILTLLAFFLQVLHGNVACRAVRHLAPLNVSIQAYQQARARLPLAVFGYLASTLIAAARAVDDDAGRWLGHRVLMVDGTGVSMPDTPVLQRVFGQPGRQKPGCGFPVMHLLLLFDVATGMIRDLAPNRGKTHDMSDAAKVHPSLMPGDVLLGDRAFCSFVHLALLSLQSLEAVFRLHQRMISTFTKPACKQKQKGSSKRQRTPRPIARRIRRLGKGDHLAAYRKPQQRPTWMTSEAFDELPPTLVVRELRYRVARPGYRTRQVTLVTTLTDPVKYPKEQLIRLYELRWQAETNLKHLKQTMGMNVLRCKSEEGVMKELWMYVMVYNLVRQAMVEAARRQQVAVDRISFVDVLDGLRYVAGIPIRSGLPPSCRKFVVNPHRARPSRTTRHQTT